MIRAIRGAITVNCNESEQILTATERLVKEIAKNNRISPSDIVSVLISTTADINACFPAAALRRIEGWSYVPVMCMQEIEVPDALEKCIRVMMTVMTNKRQHEIQHVYLEKAVQLRPDL
ncbi:chorismate mutase [Bacillus sp. NPDC077411]|uniref:chorismate mutase n=1 Tax=Bacillus bruguierae TaxID=3127667 RepID=A0ABU8FDL7_9BACI|nr:MULTISPECIES: chorismate mutase [unclassified Bacillus (in: firmicutes)]SFI14225.1 chorismate mutase [Bacillus sp. 71mf]SFS73863.1 chorismate mutase [Bacillus sp. 103mf]